MFAFQCKMIPVEQNLYFLTDILQRYYAVIMHFCHDTIRIWALYHMLLGIVPYAFGHATICILGTLPYTFKDSTMFYMIQQIILKVLITLLMLVLSKAASISSKTKNGAG